MDVLTLPPLGDRAARVLIAAGDEEWRARVVETLEAEGHVLCVVDSVDEILEAVRLMLPDLVLLAVHLTGGSGLEVLGDLRMIDPLRLMPIGLLADKPLDEHEVTVGLLGGADDVLDPRRTRELAARVAVQLRNRRDRDLLRRAQKERVRLIDDARTDPLTSLANRRALEEALGAPIDEGDELLLMVIDVDHFKRVNDTYGHTAGDDVLRALGRRLSQLARAGDMIARYGGEEFVAIVRDARAGDHRAIVERFLVGIRELRLRSPLGPPRVTASIGAVSLATRRFEVDEPWPTTAQPLLELADQCLYRAKRGGRDRLVLAPFGQPIRDSSWPSQRSEIVR